MATLGRQKLCRQQQGHVWREGGMVLRAWGGKGIDVALILVSCLSTLRWASTYGFSTPESQPASHPGSWTTALRLTLTPSALCCSFWWCHWLLLCYLVNHFKFRWPLNSYL